MHRLFLPLCLAAVWAQVPEGVVTADALKAHVSYLASDALEGRNSPSKGLDLAADYIAEKFRAIGLKPMGDDGYFQTAEWTRSAVNPEGFALTLESGGQRHDIAFDQVSMDAAPARMRNVAGMIEGTDRKEQVLIVSAHYDHLGLASSGDDRVFNGANDNASGVAGVIEVAAALARTKPRRSILFLTFFAEEKGLLGARHYTLHPLVPLEKTVANLNFEQLGRTDSSEGKNVDMVNMTGFDFSDIKFTMNLAASLTGVRLIKNEKGSDPFFVASDNLPFAEKCVVAHTLSVTYEFPDYHQVGDEWQKIDYDNMAKVVRMLATGAQLLADQQVRPFWDAENLPSAPYRSCQP
jgi:hypothetical protein